MLRQKWLAGSSPALGTINVELVELVDTLLWGGSAEKRMSSNLIFDTKRKKEVLWV